MLNENVIAKCFGRLANLTGGKFWPHILLVAPLLLPIAAQPQTGPTASLPGNVLSILPNATPLPQDPNAGQQPLTLGVVLNRSDEAGFEAFAKDYADPNSPNFHKPISADDFNARFGPTQQAYDSVLAYLEQNGFTLAMGSANRRTLTVAGTRAQAEAAFHVSIGDYQLGSRAFHAIATDPAVPAELAPLIGGVSGLSNLGLPRPGLAPSPPTPASTATAYNGALTPAGSTNTGGLAPGIDGSGQTIGLIEFDNYVDSDVSDWLSFAGLPASLIKQVSRYPVNGGTAPSGCVFCGTTEVLLDIDAAVGMAPGAKVVVFDAPNGTDPLTVVNSAISAMEATGGVISTSWGLCETEVSSSDATNMDGLLLDATYLSKPITLFAGTGDTGSTCTSGSGATYPNTTVYPADAPHAIAVGGTVLNVGAGNSYSSESWWLNAGGFGVSQYFPRPSYQDPFTTASGRSLPDVSMESQPGILICQATALASPNCFPVVGTSLATPLWAATWALAMQAQNDAEPYSLGSPALSGYFYSTPSGFHPAASMTGTGNDFAHVGLGSPDITALIGANLSYFTEVDNISPSSGTAGGGTTVTVDGKGFVGVKKVTLGGVDASKVTIYSDTKLTADSPAAGSGNRVDVQVVTPAATTAKSSKDRFSYAPEVTKVSPSSGALAGGITVTVTGRGFNKGASFDFGWAPATKVTCSSSTQCTMVNPAWGAGTVQVTAKTTIGTSDSTKADEFTYDGPAISSFTPNVGPTVGGMTVNITGVGLSDGMTVDFGGAAATGIFCGGSSTSCSVISPAGSVGSVNLTVTVSSVTSAPASGKFTYALFPTVTGVSPNSGVGAGATVQIYGTNFGTAPGGTTFSFGTQVAASVTCASTTQCAVVVPVGNGVAAVVPVEATVNGNTSLDAASFAYGDPVVVPVGTCKTCHI